MKVNKLKDSLLDLWVAKALDLTPIKGELPGFFYWEESDGSHSGYFAPSTDWAVGGPILEDAAIGWRNRNPNSHAGGHKGLSSSQDEPWEAWFCDHGADGGNIVYDHIQSGQTLLIAAMRAKVASVYGEEVPDDISFG